MNLDQIKTAVLSGLTVHWANPRYRVIRDRLGQWLITCTGGSTIGLTWADGVTLNGKPEEFFTA
jgi:hypothetical protein